MSKPTSLYTKEQQLGNGSVRVTVSSSPMHYSTKGKLHDNSEWPGVRRTSLGRYTGAGFAHDHLGFLITNQNEIVYKFGDRLATFRPQSLELEGNTIATARTVVPTIDGNTVYLRDVFDGIDLKYTIDVWDIKEEIIINRSPIVDRNYSSEAELHIAFENTDGWQVRSENGIPHLVSRHLSNHSNSKVRSEAYDSKAINLTTNNRQVSVKSDNPVETSDGLVRLAPLYAGGKKYGRRRQEAAVILEADQSLFKKGIMATALNSLDYPITIDPSVTGSITGGNGTAVGNCWGPDWWDSAGGAYVNDDLYVVFSLAPYISGTFSSASLSWSYISTDIGDGDPSDYMRYLGEVSYGNFDYWSAETMPNSTNNSVITMILNSHKGGSVNFHFDSDQGDYWQDVWAVEGGCNNFQLSFVWTSNTHTKTFTTDALLKKVGVVKTFATDALLYKTRTKTFGTDALLYKTQTKTFGTDALLYKTKTATFGTDAALWQRSTKTFGADALLYKTKTKAFGVDALLYKTGTKTFTADAALWRTSTKSFTTDSFLVNRKTVSFSADANLAAQNLPSHFSVDALIANRGTSNVSVDALLVQSHISQVTLDAMLVKHGSNWLGVNF